MARMTIRADGKKRPKISLYIEDPYYTSLSNESRLFKVSISELITQIIIKEKGWLNQSLYTGHKKQLDIRIDPIVLKKQKKKAVLRHITYSKQICGVIRSYYADQYKK